MNPTPQQQLNQMLSGYWLTQAVYVAAKLGLADLVKPGPKSADELAKATGTNAAALYRLLRALASLGVFVEQPGGTFALTPVGQCLCDGPGSQRSLAIMSGEEHYRAFAELLYSVQTGKPAFDKVFGMPVFDFLSKHPPQAKLFDEAMVGVHGRETAAMLDAYDFSAFGVLADVGGGNSSLLSAVLQRYPAMKGMLLDLPGVVERARPNIQAAGLTDRLQATAGNFFEKVPAGADAYLMRHIIHDWDDERAGTILKNIHQTMGPKGKLLVVESVIAPGNEPGFGKLLDLVMLAIPGGKERTEQEYRQLYASAGFRLTRIVPAGEVSVIEGAKT